MTWPRVLFKAAQFVTACRESSQIPNGNANALLGNYIQATINYLESASIYSYDLSISKALINYDIFFEQMRHKIWWKFKQPRSLKYFGDHGLMVARQNLASSLSHVSFVLMLNKQHKLAKLLSLQSLQMGFSKYSLTAFNELCILYLASVNVYKQSGDLTFIDHVEKYMLRVIDKKKSWKRSNDFYMLAQVYFATMECCLLKGNLKKATKYGEMALQISKTFQISRLTFEILPLMVQALIRLKLICRAMDLLQLLRDISLEDIDKSALTWYYALCMDLLLDAGILIESFEACSAYAEKILGKSDVCVYRDSNGFKRLLVCLWSWQLRKGYLNTTMFVRNLDFYAKDVNSSDYFQIMTLLKVKCHLILLLRCINLKKGQHIKILLRDIAILMDTLNGIQKKSHCIRSQYYMLLAYFYLMHDRTELLKSYLRKAKKAAAVECNKMSLATIDQNEKTWKAESYNDMACYWEEDADSRSKIAWQDIAAFDMDNWSKLLYSLPVPHAYI
ncbi:hypothetical protein TKK_0002238 [Trichogramma kaykai]